MKTLVIVRHAKSSWDSPDLSDIERPLNGRGKKEAPEMAEKVRKRDVEIDLLVSSPAKRTRKTAKFFAKEFAIEKNDIQIADEIYEGRPGNYLNVIKRLSNGANTVAVFGHNPGITDFVSGLTETRIDEMPTCGVFAVTVDIQHWEDFESVEKRFLFFDSPSRGDE